MEYIEFKHLTKIKTPTSLCDGYELEDGSKFIFEPAFYSQLKGIKIRFFDRYDEVINKLFEIVKANKQVYFVADIESYFLELEDYIYLEIEDILNPLHIYPEDKSRGSDYGD